MSKDTVVSFPTKAKPWMTPQDDFEDDARDFVANSPNAAGIANDLFYSKSPFMRAAVILCGCTAEDVPFLLRIAELLGEPRSSRQKGK